ncbi:MAG: EthD family reductase [Deltaproteobacteria bacterium]|nr:EthD family reductase [Deltaproteobacteria bacterium]
MIKVVAFLKRKPGMAVEDFQKYWLTTHANVVKQMPGLRRYVQSHTLLSGYKKGNPVYDGTAELWYDNTDALRALVNTKEFQATQADEYNFIDRAATGQIFTEEHVIKDGPTPSNGVKNIEFVTHKPGMSIEAFQKHWKEIHGPLGASIPVVRRYVQSHTRLSAYKSGKAPAYDGVAITWFDDTQAMRVSATTPEYERTRADEPNFIAPGTLPLIITKEHVIAG